MRKLLIILGVVIVIAALMALIFGRKSATPPATTTNSSFPNGGEPGTAGNSSFPSADTKTDSIPTRTTQNSDSQTSQTNSSTTVITAGKVRQAKRIAGPVAGETSMGTIKALNLVVRYVDASTGNIWDYKPLGDQNKRITISTIPRVKEVYWGNLGQSALLRYEDEGGVIKNYLLRIDVASTSALAKAISFSRDKIISPVVAPPGDEVYSCPDYLTVNLRKGTSDHASVLKLQDFLINFESASISETGVYDDATLKAVTDFQNKYKAAILTPAGLASGNGIVGTGTRTYINKLYCQKAGSRVTGGRFFYMTKSATSDNVSGISVDFDGKKETTVFSTPFSEWQVAWPSKSTLVFNTKPSSQTIGNAYSAPSSGQYPLLGALKPLIRNVYGLTVNVSPDLKYLLYGQSVPGTYTTKLLTLATGKSENFPLDTFPREKCVWAKDSKSIYCAAPRVKIFGGEPDGWYLGLNSYTDNLYRINIESGTVELLYSPAEGSGDMVNLTLAQDESFIFYENRVDHSLWALPLIDI